MAKMKTEFELDVLGPKTLKIAIATIIGSKPGYSPYVKIHVDGVNGSVVADLCVKDKDLERFAVNILKALKSKKLK